MPLNTLERDTLAKSFAVCKQILMDLQPKLEALAVIYDSGGGVKETLTQEELNELPELSGLTKQQVDDGLYALTTVILPGVQNSYPALAQMAARFL
jgi:hypothetical protein